MTANWNLSSFGFYMNSLLKRYFAGDVAMPPEDVEVRATWRTSEYVYCVFSVMSTQGIAYVGMEMPPIPNSEGVSSEEDTAVKGWVDQLAGNTIAPDLDYGSDDKIKWLGGDRDYDPKHFVELRRMKDEGAEIYIPLTAHG
ncbi:hypothetical protein AY498_05925 [Corynebacterium ulcerans]|uniref:hypothetical protein n=1 Tax=Corynebacterium ulcerans TaxID=65058 RepID=UPI000C80C3C7|nr:hypothetical protein [Corynebacterium ulcerans]PME07381.1 hypothetical protein AY498_05925 [Corynebacterium ulcerans]